MIKKVLNAIKFFARLIYDHQYYKSVAFNEEGYGTKRLAILLLVLLIPSFIMAFYHIDKLLENEWRGDLQKIPQIFVHKNNFIMSLQTPNTIKKLNDLDITWQEKMQNMQSKYVLTNYALLAKVPADFFPGFNLSNQNKYLPVFLFRSVPAIYIDGKYIAAKLGFNVVIMPLIMLCLFSFGVCFAFIYTFIRSFGYIARKMVKIFVGDDLSYAVSCRLLAISAVIPITVFFIVNYFIPFKAEYRFAYLVLYMLNFYYGVRVISSRSLVSWVRV